MQTTEIYRGLPDSFAPGRTPAELAVCNTQTIAIENNPEAIKLWVKRAIGDADFAEPGSSRISPEANATMQSVVRTAGPDDFFAEIDIKKLRQLQQQNPKEYITEPITRKDDGSTLTFLNKPKWGDAAIFNCGKIVSDYEVEWEVDFAQIQYGEFKRLLLERMLRRFKTDVRLLGWRGDSSITPTNKFEALYAATDGWKKRLASARSRSWGGAPELEMFIAMVESMPGYAFDNDELGFAWICNKALKSMYALTLGKRADEVGGKAHQVIVPDPCGIPFRFYGAIARSEPMLVIGKVPGTYTVAAAGPYALSASAKQIKISIDGKAAKTIDLSALIRVSGNTAGPVLAAAVARKINDVLVADTVNYGPTYGKVARDDDDGRLVLTSPTLGAASSVELQAVANDCYSALGLTAGEVAGLPLTKLGSDTSGTVNRGTSVVLASPKNFAMGIVDTGSPDGTRIGMDYKLETDKTRVALRNAVAFEVYNLDVAAMFTDVLALPSAS